MEMAPNDGGGASGGRPRRYTRKRKVPTTGTGYPSVKVPTNGGSSGNGGDNGGSDKDPPEPIPVVFTQQTFTKLIIWTLGPLLVTLIGAASGFLYFYHKTNTHIEDPTIHLSRGERDKLENKSEAKAERKQLQQTIKAHIDIKVREIKVEQKEQIDTLSSELKKDQRVRLNKILNEVKKINR